MEDIKSSRAVRIDQLSGNLLKDVADILVKPISVLCNLSISRGVFPNSYKFKVAKLKPISKRETETDS